MAPPNNPDGKKENEGKQMAIKYKFRSMKVHSSDEWMAEGTKKYRTVFNRYETAYLRVEFSVFNKLYDEEEWEASVRIKCFHLNGSQKNELCNIVQGRKIMTDENVVFFRTSWGTDAPGNY